MVNYLKESYNELRNHVTWTPWPEAQKLTVIVAAFSIVLALAVWGIDSVFGEVITFYFDLIKS
jgi:preprotein translocase subunit SecE